MSGSAPPSESVQVSITHLPSTHAFPASHFISLVKIVLSEQYTSFTVCESTQLSCLESIVFPPCVKLTIPNMSGSAPPSESVQLIGAPQTPL